MNLSSIKYKIIMLSAGIGIVLSFLLTFFSSHQAKELGKDIMWTDAAFVTRLLSEDLAAGIQMIILDEGAALERTLGILQNENGKEAAITKVRVFDENLEFIKGINEGPRTTTRGPVEELVLEDRAESLDAWSPVYDSEQNLLGYVEIVFSKQFLHSRTQGNSRQAWVVGIAAVFLTIIAGLILARKITQPLVNITEVAQKIAEGDLNQQKLTLSSKDEVGVLAQSFNNMLDELNRLVRQAEDISVGKLDAGAVLKKIETGSELHEAVVFEGNSGQVGQGDLAESFAKMTSELRKLTVQAITIASDDLDNPVLDVNIPGELGAAFRQMIERMKWLAGQALYIANNDLNNENLRDDGKGTLGTAMASMVLNLRQVQDELQMQTDEAVKQREHVLQVAKKVLEASDEVAVGSQELSTKAFPTF